MTELLTFAAGYFTCLLTLVGAYFIGRRLKRIVEVTTIPAPTAPNEWSQAGHDVPPAVTPRRFTHIGRDGQTHGGGIGTCRRCAGFLHKSRKG